MGCTLIKRRKNLIEIDYPIKIKFAYIKSYEVVYYSY